MTEREVEALKNILEMLVRMTPTERERFLAFMEGMAFRESIKRSVGERTHEGGT